MLERTCANKRCRAKFMARTADVKRGWGRFCSKSCKAAEQEGRTHQHANHFERMDDDDFIGHPMESGYFGHGQE
jgi:hypothetical protein